MMFACSLCFLAVLVLPSIAGGTEEGPIDFEATTFFGNGERQLREVKFRGIYSRDHIFDGLDQGKRFKVRIVEVSDGISVTRMIFDSADELAQCLIEHDVLKVSDFLESFHGNSTSSLKAESKAEVKTLTSVDGDRSLLSEAAKEIIDFQGLTHACEQLLMTNEKILLPTRNPPSAADSSDLQRPLAQRFKRELELADFARIPHTKWCGKGNVAEKFQELGGFTGADKCCRVHDLNCPIFINSLDTKYGFYNRELYTMNHCACDERFRTCLQQTGSGASELVGEIFFNILKSKCIVLKKEKVCAQRSWWGTCQRYRIRKIAVSREPLPY